MLPAAVIRVLAILIYITKCSGVCMQSEYFDPIRQICKPCTICRKGFFAQNECKDFKDGAPCLPCRNGTYSTEPAYNRTKCRDCRACPSGQIVSEMCNRTFDTLCVKAKSRDGTLQGSISSILQLWFLFSAYLYYI